VEHILFPCLLVFSFLLSDSQEKVLSVPLLKMSLFLFASAAFAVVFSLILPDAGAIASMPAMSIRLVLPAIVLMAMAVSIPPNCTIITTAAKAIVLVAIPLTLFAAATALFDMSFMVGYFIKGDEDSVWARAFALRRFTGLFNQPLEAGVFYSVALLAFVYLAGLDWAGPKRRYLILGLILIGGALSLSKNFIVLGVLAGLGYAVSIRMLSPTRGLAALCLAGGGFVAWLMLADEAYVNSFIDLFANGGLLLALTAGRLGSGDTEVAQLWNYLLTSGKWVTGVGLGSYLPLDNGYLEYFYQGGIFALLGYLLFILSVLSLSIRKWSTNEAKLLLFLGLLVAASSLGGPVVSANRANVPLLVLVAACVSYLSAYKRSDE